MTGVWRRVAGLYRSRLPVGCELIPAVKANAYGNGAVPIAQECERLGINAFCVAMALEGVELRRAGIGGEILVLGYTYPQEFPLLLRYALTQTVLDLPYAETLNSWGQIVRVHIKIDTGMHRLGECCEHLKELHGSDLGGCDGHPIGFSRRCSDPYWQIWGAKTDRLRPRRTDWYDLERNIELPWWAAEPNVPIKKNKPQDGNKKTAV